MLRLFVLFFSYVFASLNLLVIEFFGTRRLSWFFPHDVKAASDDDSGSSAAHRQVWSVGRSVGGETFRPERWSRRFHRDKTPSAGRGPETMTHRRSTRLTTTTRVSVFKKWPSQSFSKKWEVFWRLGAGSESVAGQGQARRPWLQTG